MSQTAEEVLRVNGSTESLSVRATTPVSTRLVRILKRNGSVEDIELPTLAISRSDVHSRGVAQSNREELEAPQSIEPPVEVEDNKHRKLGAHLQFATVCFSVFTIGWNDGATGPLLPRIQEQYHVGYAVVSLIFMSSFVGFLVGALANIYIVDRLGFGKAMVIGASIQLIGYAIQSTTPPFPLFVVTYAINGIGLAFQDAGGNAYVASLKDNSKTKMALLHSIYGSGAFASPLSSTQFSKIPRWSFQYLTALGVTLLDIIFLVVVFRFRRLEDALADVGQARTEASTTVNNENKYRQIFKIKEVHYFAMMLLVYVGVCTTIGGWSVTYIINVRGGGPNSGYISSGLSGGVAIGRLALLGITKLLGDRNAIFLYILLAIGLELIVWRVPSLIGDAIAVSFVGFVLGPIYPIVISHAGKILPHWLFAGAVGWIAGFGQAGSAFVPLITGAIASTHGIEALQPLMLAMMAVMLVLWFIIPSATKRPE